MASLQESMYLEMETLFDTLKSISLHQGLSKEAQEHAFREHFAKMRARLDDFLKLISRETEPNDWLKLIAMKSSLYYEEGKIYLVVQKYQEAKETMQLAMEVLKGVEMEPFVSHLHMRIINHLAFILSKMDEYGPARELLQEVTKNEETTSVPTYTTEALFATGGIKQQKSMAKIQSIYINNLQMLSWVYGKMGLENESAMTQHIILEKQMDYENCDPVDWALRCIRVASLYLARQLFVAARYYLSASTSALDRTEELVDHPELAKAQAELARSWIYYGLKLFDMSRAKHINKLSSKIFDDSNESEEPTKENEEPIPCIPMTFQNSEVPIASVPAKIIQNITEARNLFLHTQVWLKRARVFYTLRDYPYVYVNCVLDLSELYRYLAFYEPDLETQYIVNKKRSDALEMLSSVLKEVRPQCYFAVSADLLRELAEVQIELLRINFKKMCKIPGNNETAKMTKNRLDNIYRLHSKLGKVGHLMQAGDQADSFSYHNISDVQCVSDVNIAATTDTKNATFAEEV